MEKHTNLLNPTPRQIKYRNELWAKALEENPKKARGAMRRNGGRCCLQVAQDVGVSCGVKSENDDNNSYTSDLVKFFGWKLDKNNHLNLLYKNELINAVNLNDGANDGCYKATIPKNGLPHKKIAQIVRDTFCKVNK